MMISVKCVEQIAVALCPALGVRSDLLAEGVEIVLRHGQQHCHVLRVKALFIGREHIIYAKGANRFAAVLERKLIQCDVQRVLICLDAPICGETDGVIVRGHLQIVGEIAAGGRGLIRAAADKDILAVDGQTGLVGVGPVAQRVIARGFEQHLRPVDVE